MKAIDSNRWRTIDIVVASVIAVAFGVIFWAWGTVWSITEGAFAFFPPAQTLIYGVWLVPAVLAGLIAIAVIGQLLSRQLALDAAEFPVLRAIGATRASLVALSLARLAIVTVAGGVIAVVVAIAASPLMPIGPARVAEPHPGTEVNIAVLGAGFAVIALLPLALLAGAAWRAARA